MSLMLHALLIVALVLFCISLSVAVGEVVYVVGVAIVRCVRGEGSE